MAGAAIGAITVGYLVVVLRFESIPRARGFFGHSLGVLGFILMLMTEVLYTLRKRSRSARWGPMSSWLQFHIFTGLVGPYMVLLHTSWKFNGLAGLLVLFTMTIVASGFIGRYIYTAVPRTAEGAELEAAEIERQVAATEEALERQLAHLDPDIPRHALAPLLRDNLPRGGLLLVLGRTPAELSYRLRWWRIRGRLRAVPKPELRRLDRLARRRRELHRQAASIKTARWLLALWHAAHVPIGAVLFLVALAHIVASVYYATLLR